MVMVFLKLFPSLKAARLATDYIACAYPGVT